MGTKLIEIASEISLTGGSLSSSERYSSKASAIFSDDCDCYDGDCSDCYCTDCNEGFK